MDYLLQSGKDNKGGFFYWLLSIFSCMQNRWAKQVTLPLKFVCNAESWVRINTNQQRRDICSSQKRKCLKLLLLIILGDTNKLYGFYHYF